MKKALSAFLILVIVVAAIPQTIFAASISDFYDLPHEDNWAYEGIVYCIENGYMNGIDASTFSPKGKVTRGQLVTILYRIEGEPETEFTGLFDDVVPNAYYSLPVEWAASCGIVNGIDSTHFDPNANITREQIAAILHRYCSNPQSNVSIDSFPDRADCHKYAVGALAWCVENGLINGVKENGVSYLRPQAEATRDQIASILMRLMQNVLGAPETPDVSEDDYLQAYAQILRAELENEKTFARFCLVHIDGDKIPELVVSPAWVTMAIPTVYTYYDGEAVEVGSFGSMGQFDFACQENLIRSEYVAMGYSNNGFFRIVSGAAECVASFSDNEYAVATESRYYKINDVEVSKTEYKEHLNEYISGYEWTTVEYDACSEVSEGNISLLLSEPENFVLVP